MVIEANAIPADQREWIEALIKLEAVISSLGFD